MKSGFRVLSGRVRRAPLLAHHELRAEFDEQKPVSLRGIVTRFDWNNPHALLYVDVTTRMARRELGGGVGQPDRFAQRRLDQGCDEGRRFGDRRRMACARREQARKRQNRGRWPAASIWRRRRKRDSFLRAGPANQHRAGPMDIRAWASSRREGLLGESKRLQFGGDYGRQHPNGQKRASGEPGDAGKVAPFQPWAKGLYEYRQRTLLKDDPMVSCLPPGGPRMFQVAHGVQFLEQPERKRVFVMSGGGNRNWRLIYLDGRALPQSEDVTPTYFGYSSGHWDGDTLVVESGRVPRAVLVFKRRTAAHRKPAPYRKVFAAGFQHAAIRSDGERSGNIHAALVQRLDARLGGRPGNPGIFLPGQFER